MKSGVNWKRFLKCWSKGENVSNQEIRERKNSVNKEVGMLIDTFRELHRSSHQRLRELKEKSGKNIIGYFCWYTPKEIISASGALPVMVCSSSDAIKISGAHVPHFTCNTCRSALDLAMDSTYGYLDGLVGCKVDDAWKTCYDVWELHVPHTYTHFVQMPSFTTAEGVDKFFVKELNIFKASLEEFMNTEISDEKMQSFIQISNTTRAILRQLYEMRKYDQPIISGTEMLQVLAPSLSMPLEAYNDILGKLVNVLPQRSTFPSGEVRLMVVTSLCSGQIAEIFKEIEKTGAIVVVETACYGLRNIIRDIPETGDPLSNIASFYLNAGACPAKIPSENWFEETLETATEYRAQGVVFIIEKYCDPFGFVYPDLRDKFKERRIPSIKIDTGEGHFPLAQIRTRIEAFLEMIK
jgi:benzoyl-CoA reductase subunit C